MKCTFAVYLLFHEVDSREKDGIAIRLPLGPLLADFYGYVRRA